MCIAAQQTLTTLTCIPHRVACPWGGGNTWWPGFQRETKAVFALCFLRGGWWRVRVTSWSNWDKGLEETLRIACSIPPSPSLPSGLSLFHSTLAMPQPKLTSPPGKTLMFIQADKLYHPVILGTSSLHPIPGGNITKSLFQTGAELGIPSAEEEAFGKHFPLTDEISQWDQLSSWFLFAPSLHWLHLKHLQHVQNLTLTSSECTILHRKWKTPCFPNNTGAIFLWGPTGMVLFPNASTKLGFLESFR